MHVISDLRMMDDSGRSVSVTADGRIVSLTANGRWVLRPARPLLFPHARRVVRLAALHHALQRLTLTLEVRVGERMVARLAPERRPGPLARLLGLGALEVKPWSLFLALVSG